MSLIWLSKSRSLVRSKLWYAETGKSAMQLGGLLVALRYLLVSEEVDVSLGKCRPLGSTLCMKGCATWLVHVGGCRDWAKKTPCLRRRLSEVANSGVCMR